MWQLKTSSESIIQPFVATIFISSLSQNTDEAGIFFHFKKYDNTSPWSVEPDFKANTQTIINSVTIWFYIWLASDPAIKTNIETIVMPRNPTWTMIQKPFRSASNETVEIMGGFLNISLIPQYLKFVDYCLLPIYNVYNSDPCSVGAWFKRQCGHFTSFIKT